MNKPLAVGEVVNAIHKGSCLPIIGAGFSAWPGLMVNGTQVQDFIDRLLPT